MPLIVSRIWLLLVVAQLSYSNNHEHQYHSRGRRATPPFTPPIEETKHDYWSVKAQKTLQQQLATRINKNIAKNVILFLGDGMSMPTLAASRVYMGQVRGNMGEETVLHFENFPHTGLSRTYCVDMQVADSACSSTAYLGGVKANGGTIGVTPAVRRQDCTASTNASNHVNSIAYWAQEAGKATGLVTNTRVTHASPAGIYAHVPERGWEDDSAVARDGQNVDKCPDIAQQLVTGTTGSKLNVILGGGRKYFYPEAMKDIKGMEGKRKDKKNLIDVWKKSKERINATYSYVTNRKELLDASPSVDYLLGLFSPSHLSYHTDNNKDEPTLEEMTVAAINTLKKSPRGYFLFVEGGRIDHAHHDNMAKKSLDETVELTKAVAAADALTSTDDTLIVVTADHSHVMSLSGYAHRGTSILGFAGEGADGLPYTTISYANGPGFVSNRGTKKQDVKINSDHKLYKFPAMIPLSSETHGGEDVPVYARGPWSHLFSGSFEQNYIPHAMNFAACMGDGLKACRTRYIA